MSNDVALPEAYRLPDRERLEYLPAAYRLPEGEERGPVATSPPRCVFIEVTNRCNLLCETCPRTFYTYEEPRDLTLEEFKALVAQFPQMERAVLHGIGEPLINRQLAHMIRYLRERGVTVLFNSNGTLLTPAWQEALALSGLDEYRVSLDSADPETFHRIRGKPLFHRLVASLKSFVVTKERLGVKTPRISIWCIGIRENIHQVPDLIRLAAEIGVPEVYLQRMTYFVDPAARRGLGQAEQAIFNNYGEYEAAIIAQGERLSRELGVVFCASGATDPRRSLEAARSPEGRPWTACLRPWTTAYVTANGNALPCCISPFATNDYQNLLLGNVWERDFARIWNDEPYLAWRKALLSPNPHEACAGCGVYWSL